MALRIYNDVADLNQGIDGKWFELMMYRHSIKNITNFMDYMSIIKETLNNFDAIYDSRINTPEVVEMQNLINTVKGNKGK